MFTSCHLYVFPPQQNISNIFEILAKLFRDRLIFQHIFYYNQIVILLVVYDTLTKLYVIFVVPYEAVHKTAFQLARLEIGICSQGQLTYLEVLLVKSHAYSVLRL